MDYGAIDLHKKDSQIRIVTEGGEVVDRRIATTRERLTAVFEGRRPMRILLEASTESEWVAQHLETLGHEVIVADPTFAPMYSERSRRIKTDRRDVAALADACHRRCYRAAHRRSAAQRTVQAYLRRRRPQIRSPSRTTAPRSAAPRAFHWSRRISRICRLLTRTLDTEDRRRTTRSPPGFARRRRSIYRDINQGSPPAMRSSAAASAARRPEPWVCISSMARWWTARSTSVVLEQTLAADRWTQKGSPDILPDGWPDKRPVV
jgi:hypothetical protein